MKIWMESLLDWIGMESIIECDMLYGMGSLDLCWM